MPVSDLFVSGGTFFFVLRHPVADADFREDVFRLRRIGFKLPADVCHIYAEDLIVAVCIGPPYIGEDGRICNDFAGVLGQAGDDLVLDGSQVDLVSLVRSRLLWRREARIRARSSEVPNGLVM